MKLAPLFLLAALAGGSALEAQQVSRPAPGGAGSWRLLGVTTARFTADHDTIWVKGPYDNFRRISSRCATHRCSWPGWW